MSPHFQNINVKLTTVIVMSFIVGVPIGASKSKGAIEFCTASNTIECEDISTGSGIPYLRNSIFPFVPPYLVFTSEPLDVPFEIRRYLKWQHPNPNRNNKLVSRILRASGFSGISKKDEVSEYQWLGSWQGPRSERKWKTPYQKVNNIPNYSELDNKRKMWVNLKRGMRILGRDAFDFIPDTYILPVETEDFLNAYKKSDPHLWLSKPPHTTRGEGIQIIRSWNEVPNSNETVVIQKFLENQYAPKGTKIDIRFFVLTTSYDPLRSKTELFTQMTADGMNVKKFEEKFEDAVLKTVLSTLGPEVKNQSSINRYNAFQFWGADLLIDNLGNPIIVEFNAFPTNLFNNEVIEAMKISLLTDTFNLLGFNLPPFLPRTSKEFLKIRLGKTGLSDTPTFDLRLYETELSTLAKNKQRKFTRREFDNKNRLYRDSILETLTPDDVRQLMLAEDELSRSSRSYKRLYPSIGMHEYMPLSKFNPYFDMLFDAWESKYHMNRSAGIQRLQSLAQQKYHLVQ